ncbi:hypothetical protein OIU79_015893 [Salix purpurea]|uniref:Uncharacterized protein n=1 Tax=Salix purpurea TaxID=77065 RepID=A0A9Q0SQV1_SALPP|nr:hypothetical protein OIU79_015893 [Salix purpurea]
MAGFHCTLFGRYSLLCGVFSHTFASYHSRFSLFHGVYYTSKSCSCDWLLKEIVMEHQ